MRFAQESMAAGSVFVEDRYAFNPMRRPLDCGGCDTALTVCQQPDWRFSSRHVPGPPTPLSPPIYAPSIQDGVAALRFATGSATLVTA